MSFFPNLEVQSMIWSRGPWHFDRNLIVLKKPIGVGDISKLSFHMVEFWVQIHNLPLMCMNRRMARYLAKQIGTVVELLADSRECWGRFIRVKVRIDISKPLLRCLRLNVDDSGEVTTVILLYERLPEFCYACCIIGHGLRDCHDDDARLEALEGVSTKYGSWLRAASVEQSKNRSSRNEKKLDDIPSSSPQENQSANSSGSESKLGSPSSSQAEGTKHLMIAHNVDVQISGGLESAVGKDMEMIDSENICSHAKGLQVDNLEHEGTSDERNSSGFEFPKSPLKCGIVGGEKRKELSISPDKSVDAKKKKEVGLMEPNFQMVEPGSQAR
ncbi:hypothetical protein EZV62_023962 [Acer yangbiense]|uniref:Zinc knuckle CX2CX4HX4C domain-containing protein n=1 Tax=Acer yangbiense TaxID=1000413 RepID=A0A5C7H397_9ROSI|nr:hypothetical protein EZV62_023962 [Acer yangbiense]